MDPYHHSLQCVDHRWRRLARCVALKSSQEQLGQHFHHLNKDTARCINTKQYIFSTLPISMEDSKTLKSKQGYFSSPQNMSFLSLCKTYRNPYTTKFKWCQVNAGCSSIYFGAIKKRMISTLGGHDCSLSRSSSIILASAPILFNNDFTLVQ